MKALLPLLCLPLLLSACSGAEPGPYRPPGVLQVGAPDGGDDLYRRDCSWCHGQRGEGTNQGPDITTTTNGPAMYDFMLSTGRMPIDRVDERVVAGPSPYTREQIDAIVDFMRSFDATGPGIPEVDPEADLTRGLTLYQENCAACHSTTGIGGALTQGRDRDVGGPLEKQTSISAPGLGDSTALEIAEAIRVGPGTMPVFAEETIGDDDLSAIVHYVSYLQDPDDEGGAPIGRIGPVAEGAVGWIVGVGLLVLFIRWIGTKRGEL